VDTYNVRVLLSLFLVGLWKCGGGYMYIGLCLVFKSVVWFDITLLGLSKPNVGTYALLVQLCLQVSRVAAGMFPIANCTNINPALLSHTSKTNQKLLLYPNPHTKYGRSGWVTGWVTGVESALYVCGTHRVIDCSTCHISAKLSNNIVHVLSAVAA
jgi:hypothetical protein